VTPRAVTQAAAFLQTAAEDQSFSRSSPARSSSALSLSEDSRFAEST